MEQFIVFIDETIEKLRVEEKQLAESHRKDEANLVRIKMNIYDIAKTVYGVFSRMNADATNSEEKWQAAARCEIVQELKREAPAQQLYLKKMEAISRGWVESYEKAKAHDDVKRQVIEETKLNALEEIKAKYLELCGR